MSRLRLDLDELYDAAAEASRRAALHKDDPYLAETACLAARRVAVAQPHEDDEAEWHRIANRWWSASLRRRGIHCAAVS